jgi:cytochrome b6-f complex iron-sulfur subunit
MKAFTTYVLAGAGALAIAGTLRFLGYEAEPPKKTVFPLGPASKYDIGSQTVLPDVPAVLIHSANGFVALSLVCTHLGCTVEEQSEGFACPCHGSRYDRQGNLLRGPAVRALQRLRLETDADGNLILHTD